MICKENSNVTPDNPLGLQIKVNYYKDATNLFSGNGVYESYIEGYLCDKKYFRVFPFLGKFYLEVEWKQVDSIRVDGEDVVYYKNIPETYLKYVYILLNRYICE